MGQGPSRPIVEPASVGKKPIVDALRRRRVERVPIWLMRQAGRYLPEYRKVRARAGGFLELCFTPELAAEVTMQPVRRFGLDAAILFSDILVVPYALGQKVRFSEGEGPVLESIGSESDFRRLKDTVDLSSIEPVYETVARVASALAENITLIGFAGAPWTVASYMIEGGSTRDFSRVKLWAREHETLFVRLIDLLVAATSAHLIRQIEAGADAVQIFDSWASALDEDELVRWSIAPTAEIVARVKERCPGTPVIGFPRAIGKRMVEYVARTGVDAISIDQGSALDWAAAALQPIATVQGNLDPELLVAGGAAMETAATRILETLGRGPFIFNLGHGIAQNTPPDHVAMLVDLVHRWRP
jgi:uroporphyrinogen decarboxylase